MQLLTSIYSQRSAWAGNAGLCRLSALHACCRLLCHLQIKTAIVPAALPVAGLITRCDCVQDRLEQMRHQLQLAGPANDSTHTHKLIAVSLYHTTSELHMRAQDQVEQMRHQLQLVGPANNSTHTHQLPAVSLYHTAAEVHMRVQDQVEQMRHQLQLAGPAAELSQMTPSEELIQVCFCLLHFRVSVCPFVASAL